MKLVYAVSQRTDPKHPAARHLDNGEGKPMCGGNGREPLLWAAEEGEPTCKICMDLAMMTEGETNETELSQMLEIPLSREQLTLSTCFNRIRSTK